MVWRSKWVGCSSKDGLNMIILCFRPEADPNLERKVCLRLKSKYRRTNEKKTYLSRKRKMDVWIKDQFCRNYPRIEKKYRFIRADKKRCLGR